MKRAIGVAALVLTSALTVHADTLVSGTIGTNTTWTTTASPYVMTGSVTVNQGITLTIQPGVTVKACNTCVLDIWGTLSAVGTSASPIAFTSSSASPTPGIWAGIHFAWTSASNQMTWATVTWGGGANGGAISIDSVTPQLSNVTVTSSGAAGIYVTGSGTGPTGPTIDSSAISSSATYGINLVNAATAAITNTTLSNNGSYAIGADVNTNVNGLTSITATGNGGGTKNGIEQRGGNLTGTRTMHTSGGVLAWFVTGNLTVYSGTLTIDSGVTVKFSSGVELWVGAQLTAIGTSASPITFTSANASPAPGAWADIHFAYNSSTSSRISYANISYGGAANGGSVTIDSITPQLDHLTISSSSTAGIYVTGGGTGPTIDSSTITGSGTYGINLTNAATAIITNTALNSNGSYAIGADVNTNVNGLTSMTAASNGGGAKNGIEQRGGNLTGGRTFHTSGGVLAWFVTGNLTVYSSTLTIDPGVTVKFSPGVELWVGSQLIANGTSASPITFTSASATPAAGDWADIHFAWNSSPSSRLSYATVSYGGSANGGAVTVDSIAPQFDHLTISNSSTAALNSSGATICSNCQFLTSASGVIAPAGVAVDVHNSYWGASSGPSGLGPGTGLSVSGSATMFEPWLTAAPTTVDFYSAATVLDRTFNPTIGTSGTVRFTTSLSGNWSETIKDSTAKTVRTLSGSGTTASAAWDGKDSHNKVLANGTYTFDLTSTAAGGTTAPLHGRLIIDSTKLPIVSNAAEAPPLFSPNGDGVQDTANATATANFDDASWTARVKNSGGTVIRTVSLPASGSLNFAWDGKNDSGVVQPDGTYTIDCVATAGTASNTATVSVILDNTFPAVSISAPVAGTLSNVHQNGSGTFTVTGGATDVHLTNWTLDYGAGASPTSWTTLNTGTTGVTNSPIGTWQTFPLTNGPYTLRLQAWDGAGNRAVLTQPYTVGNFALTSATYQINVASGQTQAITSIVPFTLNQTLVVKNASGTVVRTLFNGSRPGATYVDSWDGHSDAGLLLPDGPYFVSASVSDAGGSMGMASVGPSFEPSTPTVDCCNPYATQSPTFDPFNNQPLVITFTSHYPGKITVFFTHNVPNPQDPCSGYCFVRNVYKPPGTYVYYWSGVDDAWRLRTDLNYVGAENLLFQLDASVIMTYGLAPTVSSPVVTPPFYGPAFGSQTVALDIASYQSQPVTVSVAYRNQASGSILRTITQTGMTPGHVVLTWDGRSDDGQWVAPGIYIVTATVTDAIGNSVSQQILTQVSY